MRWLSHSGSHRVPLNCRPIAVRDVGVQDVGVRDVVVLWGQKLDCAGVFVAIAKQSLLLIAGGPQIHAYQFFFIAHVHVTIRVRWRAPHVGPPSGFAGRLKHFLSAKFFITILR